MKAKKHIIVFSVTLLILITKNNLSGQSTAIVDKMFSVTDLQKDFKVLRSRYENNLANLYLYISKERLNEIFDSLYKNIQPMTSMEFYSYITPLSSIIKDGHSNIFPSKQITNYHNQNSSFFPFNIYWIENKMFVKMNLSLDTTIYCGEEILSINGVSVQEIMSGLMIRQVRDGYNESYALWILNNYFREYYSYHFGHPESYTLIIKEPDSKTKTIKVAAESKEIIGFYKSLRTPLNILKKISNNDFYFEIEKNNNRAIFTIKSWDDKQLGKAIDKAFFQLQLNSIDNLIVDLRDNQGGNFKPAIQMLSYLLNEPFQYFAEVKSVSGKTDTSQILKNKNGKMLGAHEPQKYPYKGKLVVLINGGCFSNTASFCSRIEFYKRGIFIGSETGGNKVVFSGEFGLKKNTILPNTKIFCENSNYQMTVTDIKLNQGHGVLPTHSINPSINDYIQNKDVALEKALELVKNIR